jgi:hypothetical protein
LVATNAGVTGGLFVPSLAFGALIGAICGKVMVSAGMLSAEYYGIMVIIGMTAFLSASSRTPLTAIVFALEALGGYTNILPIAAGVMLAYVIAESVNVTEFAEIVIEAKMKSARKDKKITTIKKSFTVQKDAFVVGKEMRDIMWPPDCIVTSIEKAPNTTGTHTAIGDVLHIQYVTCDDNETFGLLETLVGEQIHD